MKPGMTELAGLLLGASLALGGLAFGQETTEAGDRAQQQDRSRNQEKMEGNGAQAARQDRNRNESRAYDNRGQVKGHSQGKGQGRHKGRGRSGRN